MPTLTSTDNHLYAITDSENLRGQPLMQAVGQVLAGGCRLVQYRDKTQEHPRRLEEARQLQTLCRGHGARLIINDDAELAELCGAAGVHLGQSDGPVSRARAMLGEQALIGVTCHASLELARAAVAAGANYIAFGRFFPSRTKPLAPPANSELLRSARGLWPDVCTVAIGGITRDNASELLDQGADYLAICRDVFQSPDPALYASAFQHPAVAAGERLSPGQASRA